MSDAKFTKGEWVCIDNGVYIDVHAVDDKGWYLNQICIGVSYANRDDAPLIAQAKNMYEEIERDIEKLEIKINTWLVMGSPEYSAALCDLARKTELLAKAR